MNSLIAGALIAGLTFSAAPAPAPAEPADRLATLQARAEQATTERISAIDRALERLERADALTDEHRATIVEQLTADRSAMQSLNDEIAAETSVAEALESYQSIFVDYRVYAVSLPQALYAAGADRLTQVTLPRLERAYEALAEVSNNSEGLAELRALIDTASASAVGIADAALTVTPADYNADATVLAELRLELRDAAAAARDAVSAARELRDEQR